MSKFLQSFDETEPLVRKIDAIQSSGASNRTKQKQLRLLKEQAKTPLAQSQVAYYLDKQKRKKRSRLGHALCFLVVTLYTVFTAYRVLIYFHPEYTFLPLHGVSFGHLVLVAYLIAGVLLVGNVGYRRWRKRRQRK